MTIPYSSRLVGALTCILITTASADASNWPHWLGPEGNNWVQDADFNPDLLKYSTVWNARVGLGYSGVTLAAGKAFVLGHDATRGETVWCFDAKTGKEIWKYSYPAELIPAMHPGGPNASAAVVKDRVITLSKDGQLYCLSVDDGTKVWELTLTEAMGVDVPQWGFGSSPVVHGNHVFVSAGKVIAVNLDTGKMAWLSDKQRAAAYATPVVFERDGKGYVAAMNGDGFSVHSAEDGTELDHHPMQAQFNLLATTPFVLENGSQVFVGSNSAAVMLGFDGSALEQLWVSTDLKNALNTSVVVDGVAYGIDGRQGTADCRLVALNLTDGKLLWAKDKFGYGTTIGVNGSILALTENGELVTAKLTKTGYEEEGRLQVLGKTCWTTPTVANGRIYARNDQGNLVCLAVQ